MQKIQNFQDLTVWRKSHDLTLKIYSITGKFPKDEKFGLISQMRRASISIAANIAEGFKRRSKKDKINFYNIAQGSLNELGYYLILAKDLKYIDNNTEITVLLTEAGKMLNGLITSIEYPTY